MDWLVADYGGACRADLPVGLRTEALRGRRLGGLRYGGQGLRGSEPWLVPLRGDGGCVGRNCGGNAGVPD